MCFLTEIIVCVAYLKQTSRVNFRSTKVDAGNLKRKYLNRPWSTLAVNVFSKKNDRQVNSKQQCKFTTG
jgi:hypothetical protein